MQGYDIRLDVSDREPIVMTVAADTLYSQYRWRDSLLECTELLSLWHGQVRKLSVPFTHVGQTVACLLAAKAGKYVPFILTHT